MVGFPGGPEMLIVLLIILVIFGGKKIPELMGGLGKGVRSFKKGIKEGEEIAEDAKKIEEEKKDEDKS
jgi:sec-independent protein translocase protein TatA